MIAGYEGGHVCAAFFSFCASFGQLLHVIPALLIESSPSNHIVSCVSGHFASSLADGGKGREGYLEEPPSPWRHSCDNEKHR